MWYSEMKTITLLLNKRVKEKLKAFSISHHFNSVIFFYSTPGSTVCPAVEKCYFSSIWDFVAQQDLWYVPFLSASIGWYRNLTNTKLLTLWFPLIGSSMCDYYLEYLWYERNKEAHTKKESFTHAKQLLFINLNILLWVLTER